MRGIAEPRDVKTMSDAERRHAKEMVDISEKGISMLLDSPYSGGLSDETRYTQATLAFMGSLLLRFARLLPEICEPARSVSLVSDLVTLLETTPARRHALTLKLMLLRYWRRLESNTLSSYNFTFTQTRNPDTIVMNSLSNEPVTFPSEFTPHSYVSGHAAEELSNIDRLWVFFKDIPEEHVPLWLSDERLDFPAFAQHGMNAFFLPQEYLNL